MIRCFLFYTLLFDRIQKLVDSALAVEQSYSCWRLFLTVDIVPNVLGIVIARSLSHKVGEFVYLTCGLIPGVFN